MAFKKANLRLLVTDVASQTYHRSRIRRVAEIQIWSYVTDDSLADVSQGDYFDDGHDQLSRDDIIIFSAEGGWGLDRVEAVDSALGTVAFSQLAGS